MHFQHLVHGHIALSWKGTDYAKFFINGSLVSETDLEISLGSLIIEENDPAYFGRRYNGSDYFMECINNFSLTEPRLVTIFATFFFWS